MQPKIGRAEHIESWALTTEILLIEVEVLFGLESSLPKLFIV